MGGRNDLGIFNSKAQFGQCFREGKICAEL